MQEFLWRVITIKKLFYLILFFTLILSACNSSSVSIDQTFDIPEKVQNVINTDHQLQLIKKGMNAYIIFQSTETLTLTEFEVIDNILNIKFNSENQENTELKQYVFKMNPGNVKVKVLINGEFTSFDNIIDL
ncbi:peptidylprolyl isomerase [Psychrobacillus sp. FSL K6-1464]|uniref:peptidylprolyl isomerase n=2 Tax=unclassified Psychrobacillus TaxID=2636677 RepID=UPI0030F65128